ncbi:MAG: hypothetical protein ACRD44_04235 [Bryobacteraceae bacterium]
MKSILIQLDDRTYSLLNQVAPAVSRSRAMFIRKAILRAIMEAEEERTRSAYLARPDAEEDADSWEEPEEYKP